MNFAALLKAFHTVIVIRDAARRLKGEPPPPAPAPEMGLTPTPPPAGLVGQVETRLTNVLVAALREAFDRDRARLDLERTHVEEQHRRAQEALRAELRRQAIDREVARLRLLAGTALAGWIASVAMFVARLDTAATPSRVVMAASWLLLLGALGAAFTAQGRVSAQAAEGASPVESAPAGAAALWLLVAGLALAAISLLL